MKKLLLSITALYGIFCLSQQLTALDVSNSSLTKEQKIKLCEIIEPLQSRVEVVDAWCDILRNGLLSENGYLKLIKKHKL